MTSIQSIKKKVMQDMFTQRTYQQGTTLQDLIDEFKTNPNFAGWSDDDLREYALGVMSDHNQRTLLGDMSNSLRKQNRPDAPEWLQYTYEEILQMEDNGVEIPKEVSDWAHSMADSNTVEYQLDTGDINDINDADGLAADIGDAGDMGKKNVAKVFNKQVTAQEEILTQAEKEFEQYSSQLEISADDAQSIQNNALKKVQEMMHEWQTLDAKAKSGEEMSQDEKARYGQLGFLMDNEVKSSTVQIENFTTDFDRISKLMQGVSKEAKVAQDYASDTTFTANLITQYESQHNERTVTGSNLIFDGATGVVDLLKSNTIGKNLAVTSVKSGNILQNVTFTSDKSIKKVASQMKGMIEDVDRGSENISNTVSEGEVKAKAESPVKKDDAPEPPPTEDDPIVLAQINKEKESENVFAENEDFNNIDSILKRQQRKAPKQEPEQIIVD